jgi:hypothetical protein
VWDWEISEEYVDRQRELAKLKIYWEAFADNAPKESGSQELGEIEILDRS